MDLGNTILSLRKRHGLSQKSLANSSGITQTYLSQIENNVKEPNISVLKSIAEILGLPLPILFFLSLTEDDVKDEKKEAYREIGQTLQSVVGEIFMLEDND